MNYKQLLFTLCCIYITNHSSEQSITVTYDQRGYNQLHRASLKHTDLETFKTLLKKHPEIVNIKTRLNTKERKNHESTAGHLAAFHGEFEKLKWWIAYGGDLTQKDAHGKTPNMYVRDNEQKAYTKAVHDGKSIHKQWQLDIERNHPTTISLETVLHKTISPEEKLQRMRVNSAQALQRSTERATLRKYFDTWIRKARFHLIQLREPLRIDPIDFLSIFTTRQTPDMESVVAQILKEDQISDQNHTQLPNSSLQRTAKPFFPHAPRFQEPPSYNETVLVQQQAPPPSYNLHRKRENAWFSSVHNQECMQMPWHAWQNTEF